jgi:hypothetical protein
MEYRDTAVSRDAQHEIFGRLLGFLNRLDGAHIYYALGHTRPESVMVDISSPGWRWEVEFMIDGSVEIERYKSVAGVEDDAQLFAEAPPDGSAARE